MAGANERVFFIPECNCGMADDAMRMWLRVPSLTGGNPLAAVDELEALLGAHIK